MREFGKGLESAEEHFLPFCRRPERIPQSGSSDMAKAYSSSIALLRSGNWHLAK
jgi:hypothetical protein